MALRSYSGNAQPTILSGGITAAATTFTVADGTNYPDGSVAPFVLTIDSGLASEEKILCSLRTGNSFTVATGGRGWDGTIASAHDNQAAVAHTFSATDAREANTHVNDSTGDPHPQYSTEQHLAYGSRTTLASGITTEYVVPGCSKSVTVAAGRRVRIVAQGPVVMTTLGDYFIGRIRQDAVTVGRWGKSKVPIAGHEEIWHGAVELTPAAGTYTFDLTILRDVGTGTLDLSAATDNPCFISITDIGPA